MREARERAFYDARAAALASAEPTPGLDGYDHALLDALGPVDGLAVLELGCGAGALSLELLRRRARLTALDVSPRMVELARSRAERLGRPADARAAAPAARFLVAPAETTGLPDASFDRIAGKGILHHTDVRRTAREAARLLRPGGRAAFFENQARNPLLRAARPLVRLPGLHKVGTTDERALGRRDLRALGDAFGEVELRYPSLYLFEALSRALGHRAHRPLRRLDAALWRRAPALRPYGWHVLVLLGGPLHERR